MKPQTIVVRTKTELEIALQKYKKAQAKIAFVPTMGNLHEGHISLIHVAQRVADVVVVSIFVNPKQFSPNEDLDSYPRTINADLEKLEYAHVNIAYIPKDATEIYGKNDFTLSLDVPSLTSCLCGISRPHFFSGVLAVISKLFLQIRPDFAIFGKKDYQQYLVIKAFAESLDLGIEIIAADTVRESSGLAKSSRNGYLSSAQAQIASKIHFELTNIANSINSAQDITQEFLQNLLKCAKENLLKSGFKSIDYLEIRNAKNLRIPQATDIKNAPHRIFFAGNLESVRLIDNIEV